MNDKEKAKAEQLIKEANQGLQKVFAIKRSIGISKELGKEDIKNNPN
ncbi:hypothetical protein LCGC14_0674790 [marine sediment metagenome]|uniref:Uncharacterized protein n=1 Tax=marine sediment metagenome TaxID=412755 RepID=A0A0F9RAD3_9ZZZZ